MRRRSLRCFQEGFPDRVSWASLRIPWKEQGGKSEMFTKGPPLWFLSALHSFSPLGTSVPLLRVNCPFLPPCCWEALSLADRGR